MGTVVLVIVGFALLMVVGFYLQKHDMAEGCGIFLMGIILVIMYFVMKIR